MIKTIDIHKTFGSGSTETPVLRGIDMEVREGEFLAIMGKSGAGKSTLLYQLSALDRPTAGTVLIADTDVHTLSDDELIRFRLFTLGFIFQDYALIPELSALENVVLPLLMRGIDWHTATRTATEAIAHVELHGKDTHYPSELSGGEQQRVAVARAIAGKPKIIFADEPTANLDSRSGRAIIDLLARIHQSGQTVVMVTHEPEYTDMCTRIIYLEDGAIVSEKTNTLIPTTPPNDTGTSTPQIVKEITSPCRNHSGPFCRP